MNDIKKSLAKVFLILGFQVVIYSLISISQAVDSIDEEDFLTYKIVKTPMPGRLTKINVQKGQEVKVGDLLYIIEAMKMEVMVRSPFAGQIQDIHFMANDIVDGNCTLLSFTPPFVESTDMNQAHTERNKDTSVTLASYAKKALFAGVTLPGANLPGSIPSETAPTEFSYHESFAIKPPTPDVMQNERKLRPFSVRRLNYAFKAPTDDVDSAPGHSHDENENQSRLVDNKDYLIALFSYAANPPPPGSSPPDSFLSGSPSKGSSPKEMLRKPHDLTRENGKEGSSLRSTPMSPMRELQSEASQVASGDFNGTALNWVCGSIALCLLMLTSTVVSSYRLRRSQMRVFNEIKNYHFTDMTSNRFMTKEGARNMNRVIFTKWKAG